MCTKSFVDVFVQKTRCSTTIQNSSNLYSMKKSNVPKPTESELEILQILWANGPSPVRLVNEKLNEGREVGYTTTLKLMQIMAAKGLVERNTESRTHIYTAAVTEADMQQRLLQRFVDSTFRGSAMNLVMQALGSQRTSQEELDEIKALIEKMEKDREG